MNQRFCCALLSNLALSILTCLSGVTLIAQEQSSTSVDELREEGKRIYLQSCADCHGKLGQGDESAYDRPLVGDDSIGQLADLITETMPEGSPQECAGDDARAVAEYIHYAFYSEAARVRNKPPSVALARLTANQYRQSISDLYANLTGLPQAGLQHGVRAEYYDGDRFRSSNKKFSRVDRSLNFDFGKESPGEGIAATAFCILWRGGLLADVTGRYEIVVKSSCSFVFEFGANNRELINNHVQSGDKTEFRRTIHLTAGRIYPFEIRFQQRKRKTEQPPANFSLSWVPPESGEQVIPERNLIADNVPDTFALQTPLPPDDRSYGYERGIRVSRQWDEATTQGALEFAKIAYEELWPSYLRRNRDKAPKREQLKEFLAGILETAFRTQFSDRERELYVDQHVMAEPDDGEAVRRVILRGLKSPRFLYPTLDLDQPRPQRVANRLALLLFDSLPTHELLKQRESFTTPANIRSFASQQINDYRVRAKTRQFLYSWLNLNHVGEVSKSSDLYPDFSSEMVADLRASLDCMLDEIVWSDSSDYRELFRTNHSYTSSLIHEYYGRDWQPNPQAGNKQDQQQPDTEKGERIGFQPNPRQLQQTVASKKHLGILTHPYLLSALAYPDSTSPIHRGVFLIRFVLGRNLKPPAEAFTPLSPDLHPDLTTRERVDLQTSPSGCQVCHKKINGLGFALENFDAVGKYREVENGKQIDPQGDYVTRSGDQVEFSSPGELAEYLASSDDAHRAFVRRAFQHFVKQPPEAFGTNTLDELVQFFKDNDFSIRKLLVEIAVIGSRPMLEAQPSTTANQLSLETGS